MSKFQIDSIIDSKAGYAYAYLLQNGREYGHMEVHIRLDLGEFEYRSNCMIKISCQVGSGQSFEYKESHQKPYAMRYGASSNQEVINLEDLEKLTKVMRKIDKYVAKIESEYGPAETYADFCQRVLIGSGVKFLITEPTDGWAMGGRKSDGELFNTGSDSKRQFDKMEQALIARFQRVAA
jgi:hypothetical protein